MAGCSSGPPGIVVEVIEVVPDAANKSDTANEADSSDGGVLLDGALQADAWTYCTTICRAVSQVCISYCDAHLACENECRVDTGGCIEKCLGDGG